MSKFDVDDALVRKLAKLLQETGLTEIEYENSGQRIRVNSSVTAAPVMAAGAFAAPAATAAAPARLRSPCISTIKAPAITG